MWLSQKQIPMIASSYCGTKQEIKLNDLKWHNVDEIIENNVRDKKSVYQASIRTFLSQEFLTLRETN